MKMLTWLVYKDVHASHTLGRSAIFIISFLKLITSNASSGAIEWRHVSLMLRPCQQEDGLLNSKKLAELAAVAAEPSTTRSRCVAVTAALALSGQLAASDRPRCVVVGASLTSWPTWPWQVSNRPGHASCCQGVSFDLLYFFRGSLALSLASAPIVRRRRWRCHVPRRSVEC